METMTSTWRELPPVMARANCAVCHGTGWEFLPCEGQRRARRCRCADVHRMAHMRESVGLPSRCHPCSLDNYLPFSRSQSRALGIARHFASKFPAVDCDLFFIGGPGVGKTHLAAGIVRRLLQRSFDDIMFVEFGGLEEFSGQPSLFGSADERMAQAGLLVLDDLCAGAWTAAGLRPLIDTIRRRRALKRKTVFTADRERCRELLQIGRGGDESQTLALLECLRDLKAIPIR
jgi:DNA replication protein DnaC